ncbi:hypothetical protein C0584_03235 [Candidatus Parcubacteria bacterium]|nr:MAG: hypothetical protein C0584_03235 [Candidatus Parcubacteria bacterium]
MQSIKEKIRYTIFYLLLFSLSLSPFRVSAATQESLITSVTLLLVCGDGFIQGLEVCDPGEPPIMPPDLNGLTCLDYGYNSGDLGCLSDCTDYDTGSCYTCGNLTKEDAEECDASDFGSSTCITFGFTGGSLSCTGDCRISLDNCESEDVIFGGGGGGGSTGGNSGNATGFNPGSDVPPGETKVIVRGKSYPNSDVHILLDGKVIGIARTDSLADFYFETDELAPGVSGFGFWSEDPVGLKSTLLSLTFRVTSGAVTNISGVYISPTIDIDKKTVKRGDDIMVFGNTIPESGVNVHINSPQEFINSVESTEDGAWEFVFNTEPLEEEFHTAKAMFTIASEDTDLQSGFSKSISFFVGTVGGTAVCDEADLNADGRVNITDFSILLYHWGTDNECADQNQNGEVDLIDFSVMMYYWTG